EKDELMNRLWPDTFVEEANLASNIKQLRKSLGDDARQPVFIETVARRGYRFIAPVNEREEQTEGEVAAQRQTVTERGELSLPDKAPLTFRGLRPTWIVGIAGATAVLMIAAVAYWKLAPITAPDPQIRSLVVLPLENLSGDPAQDYLADGMTDALIG